MAGLTRLTRLVVIRGVGEVLGVEPSLVVVSWARQEIETHPCVHHTYIYRERGDHYDLMTTQLKNSTRGSHPTLISQSLICDSANTALITPLSE